jgi:hypothetical protein
VTPLASCHNFPVISVFPYAAFALVRTQPRWAFATRPGETMSHVRSSTEIHPTQLGYRAGLRGIELSIAARKFYRGILGGRQVWPTDRRRGLHSLWFLVGDTLVEVDPAPRAAPAPVEVAVDSPNEIAERCWNAGYTVRLRDPGADDSCSEFVITDPFGRSITLTSRANSESVSDAMAG